MIETVRHVRDNPVRVHLIVLVLMLLLVLVVCWRCQLQIEAIGEVGVGGREGRPPGSRPEIGQGQRQGGGKIKWATKGGQHQIEGHPITH